MYYLKTDEREWQKISPIAISIAFMASTIILALKFHPWFNLLIFIGAQFAVLLLGMKPKTWIKYFVSQIIMATAIFMTGYYYTSPTFELNTNVRFSKEIWNGLQLSARALSFSGLGVLFASQVHQVSLIESSMQMLKVPRKFAYGILAAWGIFPKMKKEHETVLQAMRSRGISVMPFSPKVIRIMLVKAIRWSDHLAIALISRGLTDYGPMTSWRIYRWHYYDFLFMAGMPMLTAAILYFWSI